MRAAPAIFVQPHYDDVALSCGGTAADLAQRGHRPRMVTVFASEVVEPMVTSFADWKHARWGLSNLDDVVAARRSEDACAADCLGCGLRWLGMPDAIYRGERYASDSALYGRVHHEEEQAFANHLAEELMHLPEWREGNLVMVPLGVGQHVDHQLVFEAGRALARRGVEVWAYEDLPYAIHTPGALPQRLQQVQSALGEEFAYPVANSLEAKLQAIACYATQLPVIFRFTDDFRAAVTQHAESVSGGPAAERFWRVVG